MPFQRILEPEWLDDLSPEDPGAIGSRRDLQRLNVIMSAKRPLAHCLSQSPAPARILEIGAGDGSLLLAVIRMLPRPGTEAKVTLLDRHPVVTAETIRDFERAGWGVEVCACDVFDWINQPAHQFDAIVANLFLHHFSTEQLERLFQGLALRTSLLVALEPRRAVFGHLVTRLIGLIGCNRVTRHDAVLSVRAGFAAKELSKLWPQHEGWRLQEKRWGPFSHYFEARLMDGRGRTPRGPNAVVERTLQRDVPTSIGL